MAKYIFDCSQGHEPETLTVEAANDNEAIMAMLDLVRPHLSEKHPEMASMGEEDVKNLITAGWKKEEGEAGNEMTSEDPTSDTSGAEEPDNAA